MSNYEFAPDFLAFLDGLPEPAHRSGAKTRIFNCFARERILTFDDLLSKTEWELLLIPYLGRKYVNLLDAALEDRGLSLSAYSSLRKANRPRCPTCGQIIHP